MQLIGGGNSATIIDPLIRALRAAIAVILHTILGAVCAKPITMGQFPLRLLPEPATVCFQRVTEAIDAFNASGRNPFGPNVPVRSHSPLLFQIEGPGISIEFEFEAGDRSAEAVEFLKEYPSFLTRHAVIYPMTRALIARQWHRVYAFDVLSEMVVDVKLLVARKADPDLFARHLSPSAWPWIIAVRESREPVAFGE